MSFVSQALSSLGINIGNVNEYPVSNMNYFVIFGASKISFSKISGLTVIKNETKGVLEGGVKEPYITTKGSTDLSTMVLEKGFGTVDVNAMVTSSVARSMILIIRGEGNAIKGAYYTDRMVVKSLELSDLDAMKPGVWVQKLSISYTTLNAIDATALTGLTAALSVFDQDDGDTTDEAATAIAKIKAANTEVEKNLTAVTNTGDVSFSARSSIYTIQKENEAKAKAAAEAAAEAAEEEAKKIAELEESVEF